VAIDTVVVNANKIPFVNISGNLIICEGESTTLTATPGFVSYSWSNGFINSTVVNPSFSSQTKEKLITEV
jgi:DNA gyrase/topoisomerase IV subunit B